MKRNTAIAALLLVVSLVCPACAPTAQIGSAEASGTPAFFQDLGKTLRELEEQDPEGALTIRLDGFPDSAAACFENPRANHAAFFFGGQSGDFAQAMNALEDELKCAGFVTTASALFPDMAGEMSFRDFFPFIGVDDYEYFCGADVCAAEGWLKFTYLGMEVMLNTNEAIPGGGWSFTDRKRVSPQAPASIVDPELFTANQALAEVVMFDSAN